jgi:hypothetical protein
MTTGAAGFDGGAMDFAAGHVLGIRQWARHPDGMLAGVHGFSWKPGENVASCDRGHPVPWSADPGQLSAACRERDQLYAAMQRAAAPYPKGIYGLPQAQRREYDQMALRHKSLSATIENGAYNSCGCGFWSYWELNPSEFSMGEKPIVGVIKGYGRTLIGKRGFRCEKAVIVGLHLAYEYVKPRVPEHMPERQGGAWASVFGADYETATEEGLAKIAADEHELAMLYPDATIYATLPALLAAHPPSKEEAEG